MVTVVWLAYAYKAIVGGKDREVNPKKYAMLLVVIGAKKAIFHFKNN